METNESAACSRSHKKKKKKKKWVEVGTPRVNRSVLIVVFGYCESQRLSIQVSEIGVGFPTCSNSSKLAKPMFIVRVL